MSLRGEVIFFGYAPVTGPSKRTFRNALGSLVDQSRSRVRLYFWMEYVYEKKMQPKNKSIWGIKCIRFLSEHQKLYFDFRDQLLNLRLSLVQFYRTKQLRQQYNSCRINGDGHVANLKERLQTPTERRKYFPRHVCLLSKYFYSIQQIGKCTTTCCEKMRSLNVSKNISIRTFEILW